jgi:hypothetical protein
LIQVHSIGELPNFALVQGILVIGRGQSKNEAVRVTVTPAKIRTGSTGGGYSSMVWNTGDWREGGDMGANERGNRRMRWEGNLRIRVNTQRCGQVGALQGTPREKGGPWTWLLQCVREGAASAGRC